MGFQAGGRLIVDTTAAPGRWRGPGQRIRSHHREVSGIYAGKQSDETLRDPFPRALATDSHGNAQPGERRRCRGRTSSRRAHTCWKEKTELLPHRAKLAFVRRRHGCRGTRLHLVGLEQADDVLERETLLPHPLGPMMTVMRPTGDSRIDPAQHLKRSKQAGDPPIGRSHHCNQVGRTRWASISSMILSMSQSQRRKTVHRGRVLERGSAGGRTATALRVIEQDIVRHPGAVLHRRCSGATGW